MENQVNPNLLKGNAYRIFTEEINKHLLRIEKLADGSVLVGDDLYAASAMFHTIKGGAGFFGLRSLASVAGELEVMLISPGFDWEENKESIINLATELIRFVRELPNPAN